MRSLAGVITFSVMLIGTSVSAQEATLEQSGVAASAPRSVEAARGATSGSVASAETDVHVKADGPPPANANSEPAVAAPPSVAAPPPPPITLVLNADLGAQRLTVVENGKSKYSWPISSGRSGFATPKGTFHPQWASRMWYSRQYEYAPMPHAVFFHRGTAFHGTSAVGLLGQPASHGCVRLAPGNAALLFKLVHRHGYASTKVVVHGGSRHREPSVARRRSRTKSGLCET